MDEYISIIITSYNAQQWLSRCLDSVIAAADDSCEIIVVDDGSEDQSAEIASEYEDRDDRIASYAIKHGGLSAARKFGVENCSGDSVIFVDCDDTLPPNSIAEFRASSTPESDIVCGNVVLHGIHGKKQLTLSGSMEHISGTQFAIRTLSEGVYSSMVGKKFARYLFDVNEWDTDETLGLLYQSVHLLHLACTANKVIIAPRAIVYNHIGRHNSMSSMFALHLEGIERAWNSVHNLPLPSKELTQWGLDIIDSTLLQRGYPFSNDYTPVVELRERAKHLQLSAHHKKIVQLLGSKRLRTSNARANVSQGELTINTPHISFIVPVYNNPRKLLRTVKSIIATGLRNIEIIVVDDASNHKTSVSLSHIAIRYPRIILHRHPTRFGIAQSRRTGLNIAKGNAVFFVDAGDKVMRDGVFNAALLIDNGAELAYFTIKRQLWPFPFKRNYFVPSRSTVLKSGIDEIFYTLLERGYLNASLRAVALSRKFITSDMLCERGVRYGSGYLTMLNILMARPIIAETDAYGYINTRRERLHAHKPKHRCHQDIELSQRVIKILKENDELTEYTASLVAQGLTNSLSRTIAAVMANPIKGKRKAAKLANKILSWNNTESLFEKLGFDMPHPDDLLDKAQKIVKENRMCLILGLQRNY